MKIILFLGCVLISCNALSLVQEEWDTFKVQHGKKYSSHFEEQRRLEIFLENKQKIADHNAKFERGEVSFKMGVNKFADLTPEEFFALQKGLNSTLHHRNENNSIQRQKLSDDLPSFVDWRQKGAVTPVKNQGEICWSCWAFGATGAIESHYFLKTGKLVSLSEQNLIDCCKSDLTQGCNGGFATLGMQYVIDHGGIDTEESYPYEEKDGNCRFNTRNIGATISSIVELDRNEDAMKEAVAKVGPVSAAVFTLLKSFHFYESGIFYDKECMSNYVNHEILVVGYGTENGTDYWIVKNSFGESWGEDGYFRLARNKNSHCGIAYSPSYPVV